MINLKTLKRRRANKKLIKEFPFLEIKNVWTGKSLDCPYDFTWLDNMPDG